MKTAKEIFTIVRTHLLTQNKRASGKLAGRSDDICLYRAPDGCKCAAGVLIDDEHYTPNLESKRVSSMVVERALKLSGIDMDNSGIYTLVMDLQGIHDMKDPPTWGYHLACLGAMKGLI